MTNRNQLTAILTRNANIVAARGRVAVAGLVFGPALFGVLSKAAELALLHT